MTPPHVWLDGRVVPTAEARVHPYDRGLLLGDGLYDTVCATDGRLFRLPAHIARLAAGAQWLGIPVETDPSVWAARFAAVLELNGHDGGRARVRITVTRGVGGYVAENAGLTPTVLITSDAIPESLDSPGGEAEGIATWPVRMMRHPDTAAFKTLALLPAVVAHRQMRARGADARDEPLFATPDGWLLEGSTANLFVVRADGAVVTPPLSRPLLPGITRATVLELLPDAIEADLRLEDLLGGREAFFTRSTRGVTPIVRVERQPLGDGRPGPRTMAARAAYAALVSRAG